MAGPALTERFFEDYSVGERFESMGRTIDQTDINQFAGLTLDSHPAHVDEQYAAARYGGRIAHGLLTFALVTGLTTEYNTLAISYGYERLRFPHAVRPGDTIRATAEVTDCRPHKNPKIGLVVKRYTGTNQDGEVVFVGDHILAVDRCSLDAT